MRERPLCVRYIYLSVSPSVCLAERRFLFLKGAWKSQTKTWKEGRKLLSLGGMRNPSLPNACRKSTQGPPSTLFLLLFHLVFHSGQPKPIIREEHDWRRLALKKERTKRDRYRLQSQTLVEARVARSLRAMRHEQFTQPGSILVPGSGVARRETCLRGASRIASCSAMPAGSYEFKVDEIVNEQRRPQKKAAMMMRE